jgi:hypothetical protein
MPVIMTPPFSDCFFTSRMASFVQLLLSLLAFGFLRMVIAFVGQKVTHLWQFTQFASLLWIVSVSGS